jgi:predicted lipoprotein with Yx(FWY)xxD motif
MKRLILLAAAIAAAGLIVVLVAGGSSDKGTAQGAAADAGGAAIAVRSTEHGRVLVDDRGRTLYLFEADKPNRSACSGACLSIWPAVTSAGAPQLRGAGLTGKAGTIPAAGGKRQVTYNGHPLYLYAGDRRPGDTAGQGLDQFGAKWYVVGPNGSKVDDD